MQDTGFHRLDMGALQHRGAKLRADRLLETMCFQKRLGRNDRPVQLQERNTAVNTQTHERPRGEDGEALDLAGGHRPAFARTRLLPYQLPGLRIELSFLRFLLQDLGLSDLRGWNFQSTE